jgi:hypothetical protein
MAEREIIREARRVCQEIAQQLTLSALKLEDIGGRMQKAAGKGEVVRLPSGYTEGDTVEGWEGGFLENQAQELRHLADTFREEARCDFCVEIRENLAREDPRRASA